MAWSTWLFAIIPNLFIVGQEWFFLLVYRDGSLFFFLHAQRAAKYRRYSSSSSFRPGRCRLSSASIWSHRSSCAAIRR